MRYLRHIYGIGVSGRSRALKKQPDILLVLAAAFGLGVILTLMLPMASGPTVAAPASPLQAGVIDLR